MGKLGPADRCLQSAAFTFDASVLEIFWPLIVGGRTVLKDKEASLAKTIDKFQVTRKLN